jgi:hypothetical protein
VNWTPSVYERRKHPDLPADANVSGRLIAARVGRGKKQQWLYLFTTVSAPAAHIVDWYGKRWNIETDLRTLKQTIRIGHLTAQSSDMVQKELMIAVLAYNLVRAVMCVAAEHARVPPRRLSFTYSCNYVLDAIERVLAMANPRRQQQELDRLVLMVATSCKLPNRSRRKPAPRAVWGRGYRFPARDSSCARFPGSPGQHR